MIVKNSHIIKSIVTAIVVTMFFSCKDNFKEIQQIGVLQNEPIGIAEHINLKYTDSGKVKANLLSPKMKDFSNRQFAFTEFPEGIKLMLYDKGRQSTILSDYAISYDQNDLIDLQDNVIIITQQGDSIFANQLYYDQKNEQIFTNEAFKMVSPTKIITGNGFNSDKDFKHFEALEVTGIIYLDE
ncbi:LPS export ABC transporter periplasmic protein LptC [Subsaxibacter sp. CAU 1640]|uniref:LPS export ABC transporter periplasmic protein LptC n=1 Tax=Subsaxibacter sp. CAU 1640 TaxID=2933271 RepID=UPI0021D41E93|nr:LPS export ABC transporter periplasmic protein LptC [Subsaxibacter sp. CAU 1640]